jgi:hypothetical protein
VSDLEVKTGGNDNVLKAQELILQAREKLVTAKSHLDDEGRLVPVMTCEAVLSQLLELMREVGLS